MTDRVRPTYEFGPFLLDRSEQILLRRGQPVRLTPKVFDLLAILVENHGHLVSKERLTRELWPETFVDDNSLNRSVSVLRKALGDGPDVQPYIETVPKRGYRFVGDVKERTTNVAEDTDLERSRRRVHRPLVAIVGIATLAAAVLVFATNRHAGDRGDVAGRSVAHRQITFGGKEGLPALSPDGKHVAYISNESPQRKVIVQELAGGSPTVLFSAPEIGALRWSPDGSSLLLFARGTGADGLYVVPASGGSARRVSPRGPIACWAPDGLSIVVAQPLVGTLTIVSTTGVEQRTVALRDVHRWISDLDWSAKSDRLLVASNDDEGHSTIWSVQPDGHDQREIVVAAGDIPTARWARSGDSIYYFRREAQTYSLYKVPSTPLVDDRQTTPILTGLETDGSFAISGDGATLVYARVPYHSNLWKVETGARSSGTVTTRQLTMGTALVERPDISPDGSEIVFNIGREPVANLYTMSAAGGTPKQLTFLNGFTLGGVWSADGRAIAFASNEKGRRRVWVVDVGGQPPRPLSTGEMSDSFDITWAPGSTILYQQVKNRNYYALDATAGDERLIARDPSVGWLFSPAIAPDHQRIAVAWSRRQNAGVWVIDSRASTETLVYGASVPSPIGWSPDGRSIFAIEGKRAAYRDLTRELGETLTEARILKIDVKTGRAGTLVDLPFDEVGGVAISHDGSWLVCAVYSSRSDVWIAKDFD